MANGLWEGLIFMEQDGEVELFQDCSVVGQSNICAVLTHKLTFLGMIPNKLDSKNTFKRRFYMG